MFRSAVTGCGCCGQRLPSVLGRGSRHRKRLGDHLAAVLSPLPTAPPTSLYKTKPTNVISSNVIACPLLFSPRQTFFVVQRVSVNVGQGMGAKAAPAVPEKAAVTAKAAMTAVTAVTAMAAKAPSATASPRTASAPRPLVRRASREATSRSACQNCHVPMSLCHCQKSACSICGLSALNCSCKARPSSASPRPASAPVCQKCAKLDESLSKAQAQHKVLERELAARRVGHVGHAGHVARPAAAMEARPVGLC